MPVRTSGRNREGHHPEPDQIVGELSGNQRHAAARHTDDDRALRRDDRARSRHRIRADQRIRHARARSRTRPGSRRGEPGSARSRTSRPAAACTARVTPSDIDRLEDAGTRRLNRDIDRVADPAPTLTITGTLLPGVTSHGTWNVSCSRPMR